MSTTTTWRRLPVALLCTALTALGAVGLPVATAAAATPAAAPAAARVAAPAAAPAAMTVPATAHQSAGSDFWVTFQRNASSSATAILYITGATSTTGDVNWAGTDAPFTVTAGQVTEVDAPAAYNLAVYNEGADTTSPRLGVEITAGAPVTAYGLQYAGASSDAFLSLPTAALGMRYRVVSASQTSSGVRSSYGPSRILVVATAAGANVQITPSETVGGHTAGVAYGVSLGAGSVYSLATNSNATGSNNLTGTLVTSDNAVAVFAGVDNGALPGASTTDLESQELAPTTEWGTDFLASRFDSESAGTPLRIVADTDGTFVTVSGGGPPIALNSGESYATTVANVGDSAVVISSNNPVEVEQYMVNNLYATSTEPVTGDPSAMLLPPITQWESGYTFATPGSGFASNFVNIVTDQSTETSVELDGSIVPLDDFTDIPNTTDAVAQEAIGTGPHTMNASGPFGIYVYGANNANSYAYPGGSAFNTPGPTLTPQTITFGPLADAPLVASPITVSATSDSGLTVVFTSTTPSVCTVSGTTVSLLDHGTCTIDADQPGDETYDVAPTVAQSFTVTEPQTITFPTPPDTAVDAGPVTLSATAPGGSVSYTSTTTSVCTVSGSSVTLITTGTCTIAADQAGGNGIDAAPTVTRSFTVLASQSITLTQPPDTDLAAGSLTLTATASSGLPVTFTSTTPAVCTVSDTTVTFVTSGTCGIDADQIGNPTTAAAPTVPTSFIVLADQTIDFPTPADTDLAAGSLSLTATAPGGAVTYTSATTGVCTVTGSTVTFVAAGTCTISADQGGNENNEPALTVTKSFTILADQTISFTGPADTDFADATVTVSATADSGLPVTFTSSTPLVCTVSDATVTLVSAGTCTIDADQVGTPTTEPATTVSQSFTVLADQTIDFPQPADAALADGTATLSATAPGGTVTFTSSTPSVCTVSVTTVTLVSAGTCTVAADQSGTEGTEPAPTVTRSFHVRAAQIIDFTAVPNTALSAETVTLTASAPGGTVTFTSSTPLVCTVSDATVTLVMTGTCSIDADQAGDGTHFAAETVTRSFTVLADQAIDFPQPADAALADGTATLSATAPAGTVTFTSSTPSVCTVSGTTVTLVSAGTCTVAADQTGNDSTAAAPTVTRSFQVRAAQTITFTGPGTTPLSTGTVTLTASAPGGDVGFTSSTPQVCIVEAGVVTLLGHGTCTVTAHQGGDETHLAAPDVQQSFTVTEPQAITFDPPADAALSSGTLSLSASAPAGTVTFTTDDPSVCTVTGSTVTLISTGTCTVTAHQGGGDGYLAATAVSHAFQIKTGQTITFTPPADAALGSGPVALVAASTSGLTVVFSSATPEVCSVSGTVVTLLAVGTCTVAADDGGSATYLAAPTVMRSFTVTPALAAPAVLTSPTAVSVQAGATATFTASATGYPVPTVQWQVLSPGGSWTDIAGATALTYTTGPLGVGQTGTQYRAVFTNGSGTAVTDAATVTVTAVPLPTPLVLESQTLWGHIEIAAHATRIPFTIRFNQSRPALSVVLTEDRTGAVLGSTTVRPAHPGTSFTGAVDFGLGDIHDYGSYTWTLTTHGGGPSRVFTLHADLRQHSTLLLHARRTGARVTLTGVARVFSVQARNYVGWADRVVLVQQQTRSGWVTVARVRTDGRGRIDAVLHLPHHLTLRLVDQDTPTQWGRTSVTRTV